MIPYSLLSLQRESSKVEKRSLINSLDMLYMMLQCSLDQYRSIACARPSGLEAQRDTNEHSNFRI